MKVALLYYRYGRSMFAEALPRYPGIDEVQGWHKSVGRLEDFDIIILSAFAGLEPEAPGYKSEANISLVLDYLENNNLWDRVIIWDERADWNLWKWGLDRVSVYFKKSWPTDKERILREKKDEPWPEKVHYLGWPVLDLYAAIPHDLYHNRDIDIGCYFGYQKENRLTSRRRNLLGAVVTFDWGHDSCIELTNTCGGQYQGHNLYHKEPMVGGKFNWWHVYMQLLRRTKIIFTSPGYPGFFGADRRTAEAVSSGALVFTDEPNIQMPYPFEHGKHLFFFDAHSDKALNDAMELAKQYLLPERKEERETLARACVEHALEHHRTDNYVAYAMDIIKREKGWD